MTSPAQTATSAVTEWFRSRLPEGLYTGEPTITVDRDEILVVGPVSEPQATRSQATPPVESDVGAGSDTAAIAAHRERTREARVEVARAAEETFHRKVSWGARSGEVTRLFTHLSSPVMTRLRQPERQILDLLVEAGVARSRSEAVAWCVRLVSERESEWLADLHAALDSVRDARARGPMSSSA